jgi:hypothetical protein
MVISHLKKAACNSSNLEFTPHNHCDILFLIHSFSAEATFANSESFVVMAPPSPSAPDF